MNQEKELEILKAQQLRLVFYLLVPGTILFAFVTLSNTPILEQLIAPVPVGLAMIILCAIDFAILIPIIMRLNRIKKQIIELTGNNSQ